MKTIEQLPESMCKLKKLEMLRLGGNPIETLPDTMRKLKKLRIIARPINFKILMWCLKNNIKTIFGEVYFPSHKIFDLSGGSIKEIPDNFFETLANAIPDLRSLDLSRNQLERVSDSIGVLTKLKVLNLRRNKLKQLPSYIGNLMKLEELILAENQLEQLNYSIIALTKLKKLDLEHNMLKRLPLSMVNLKNLREINLRDNQWQIDVFSVLPHSCTILC